MIKKIMAIIFAVIIVGAFIIRDNQPSNKSYKLNTFKNKSQFVRLLKNSKNKYIENRGLDFLPGTGIDMQIEENTSETTKDYSGTNTQVDGVDESDTVKTDGKYIYTFSNNSLLIVKALPAKNAKVHKRIEYKLISDNCEMISNENYHSYKVCDSFNPYNLYVDDNYVVVIGSYYDKNYQHYYGRYNMIDCMDCGYYRSGLTRVFVYDKSKDFKMVNDYIFEGYLSGTRKIDNNMFFVVTKGYHTYYFEEKKQTHKDEDLLPYYMVNGEKKHLTYDDIKYHDDVEFNSVSVIYGIDLNNKNKIDFSAQVGNSHNLYMSNKSVYLVDTKYIYESEKDVTSKIISSFGANLSIITKYDIDGNELKNPISTTLPGGILNQFSMDEHEKTFRIATTERANIYSKNGTNSEWQSNINNRLFILDENLEIISKLEGLGKKGESFHSCRFTKDTAYLVTFLRTDPFYVIDISNPSKPQVLSELEISGFSTYQHPYDDNHIIGIGFEADKNGLRTGLKLSIYDVTNKNKAKEIHKEVINFGNSGWAHSSVTYDHKQLLFSKEKGIIAFPLSISNYNYDEENYEHLNGYMVYNIDLKNGFVENGFISLKDYGLYDSYRYVNHIKKGLYLNDFLYTISDKYILINELADVKNNIKIIKLLD